VITLHLALAASLVVAVTECSGPLVDPSDSVPSGASAAAEIAIGGLAAGRYTNSEFTPRIEVEVPSGWLTYHLSPQFFDVATDTGEGVVVVMFLRPLTFRTPTEERAATDPEDAIAMLGEHEGVTVSTPREIEIDGVSGLQVDVQFAIDNTHLMRVEGGLIGFGPTTDVRLAYLETDEGVLVIGLNAPDGRMAEAERLSEDVWASIRIGG
jgi:hypothetical protein